MATQTPQSGESRSESSEMTDAYSIASFNATQQQCRQRLVHRDAANAAPTNMNQDAYSKTDSKTGIGKHKKQYAIGSDYTHIEVDGSQLTWNCTAGIARELCEQFVVAPNKKPTCLPKAFIRMVHEVEHYDVVSSGLFADQFHEKCPWQCTKWALNILKEATEA